MQLNADEILRTASRIKSTQDGIDFIDYLKDLSQRNYGKWKCCEADFNEFLKGQAVILDKIIALFEDCDNTLRKIEEMRKQAEDEKFQEELQNAH
jgi:hypothetical protein